jgi:hypothetical protein
MRRRTTVLEEGPGSAASSPSSSTRDRHARAGAEAVRSAGDGLKAAANALIAFFDALGS